MSFLGNKISLRMLAIATLMPASILVPGSDIWDYNTYVSTAWISSAEAANEGSIQVEADPFDTEIGKSSYAIGIRYGQGLKAEVGDINLHLFLKGLKDAHEGEPLLLDEPAVVQLLTKFKHKRISQMQAEKEVVAAQNKLEGEQFLENNKEKEGVVSGVSGLQYKVIKEGTGIMPSLSDTVRVHYHGTLINGLVFDSSVNRGESITFRVSGVIKGWTEALQLMKVGAKWQLYIPSELAYGLDGAPEAIGPNSALVFDVELIAIES